MEIVHYKLLLSAFRTKMVPPPSSRVHAASSPLNQTISHGCTNNSVHKEQRSSKLQLKLFTNLEAYAFVAAISNEHTRQAAHALEKTLINTRRRKSEKNGKGRVCIGRKHRPGMPLSLAGSEWASERKEATRRGCERDCKHEPTSFVLKNYQREHGPVLYKPGKSPAGARRYDMHRYGTCKSASQPTRTQ